MPTPMSCPAVVLAVCPSVCRSLSGLSHKKYWDFTFDHHGKYDVAAFVDHIRQTKQAAPMSTSVLLPEPPVLYCCISGCRVVTVTQHRLLRLTVSRPTAASVACKRVGLGTEVTQNAPALLTNSCPRRGKRPDTPFLVPAATLVSVLTGSAAWAQPVC